VKFTIRTLLLNFTLSPKTRSTVWCSCLLTISIWYNISNIESIYRYLRYIWTHHYWGQQKFYFVLLYISISTVCTFAAKQQYCCQELRQRLNPAVAHEIFFVRLIRRAIFVVCVRRQTALWPYDLYFQLQPSHCDCACKIITKPYMRWLGTFKSGAKFTDGLRTVLRLLLR